MSDARTLETLLRGKPERTKNDARLLSEIPRADRSARHRAARFSTFTAGVLTDMVASAGRAALLAGPLAYPFFLLPALLFSLRMRQFDRRIERDGIRAASSWLLTRYSGRPLLSRQSAEHRAGQHQRTGTLVVANHPGVVDALALLSALDRDDVSIVAMDRSVLASLPALRRHLIPVPREPRLRVATVRTIVARLAQGGMVVLFPAGEIEPDPAYAAPGIEILKEWTPVIGLVVLRSIADRFPLELLPVLLANVFPQRARRNPLVRVRRTGRDREESAALDVLLRGRARGHRPSVIIGQRMNAATLGRDNGDARTIAERVRGAVRSLGTGVEPE
ncbi:1-acyl-sn-glycerol-3-phosphate acyltransferase [Salinispira pacifica]